LAISDSWLTTQLAKRKLSITKFAGLLWVLDARGVAYLPALDWLVVSDLHLEKGSYLRSYGNPLPSVDSQATLKRLARIIEDYQPARVISLGDSFHDKHSMARMTAEDRAFLCNLVSQVTQWSWVEGNHDPDLPEGIPGEALEEIRLKKEGAYDIVFRHEPTEYRPNAFDNLSCQALKEQHLNELPDQQTVGVPSDSACKNPAQIIGHFHPKMRTAISRRRYSGKCFISTNKLFVMPAFGQFTGGLDIEDEVMLALLPKKERHTFMMYDEVIFKT
jgi:metallophosphoesterase superfamily enzyme|tara:strand:+ start:25162 stop:25986 length:825 start_codon:yes stop_codon:yes gene_type:complete